MLHKITNSDTHRVLDFHIPYRVLWTTKTAGWLGMLYSSYAVIRVVSYQLRILIPTRKSIGALEKIEY